MLLQSGVQSQLLMGGSGSESESGSGSGPWSGPGSGLGFAQYNKLQNLSN